MSRTDTASSPRCAKSFIAAILIFWRVTSPLEGEQSSRIKVGTCISFRNFKNSRTGFYKKEGFPEVSPRKSTFLLVGPQRAVCQKWIYHLHGCEWRGYFPANMSMIAHLFRFYLTKAQVALVIFLLCLGNIANAASLTVFAAASLKEALEDVADRYQTQSGTKVVLSFAGSSILARQIELGAPADIFFSANVAWMDVLGQKQLLVEEGPVNLLSNRLVLVSNRDAAAVDLSSETDLVALLEGGRLAMALVDAVPAGIYGKAALRSLKLWQDVAPHVAQTDNVRAALALVTRGEVPLGIVYATDVVDGMDVSIVATFPPETHPKIVYPVAAIAEGNVGEARAFLSFLQTDDAKDVFRAHGFQVIERADDG
ncbi:molybdate ABC transporter substrate-binding protein [Shimia thalassica]|uniref:molybdate ABC transporter substrate-binding protein n=1 Tax=Shimia thalassica TaxID=1715693 RepID=UPI002493E177|nr:molybdate ABC transporter substrate-binding protein [Shimia thalassica]